MSTTNPLTPVRYYFKEMLPYLSQPKRTIMGYSRADLQPDLLAGLTLAVLMLPQAIAYAVIAELPPQMGIYGAIVASIVGALWGSSNQLNTGPTNTTTLVVLTSLLAVVPSGTPEYIAAAGLMAVMVGVARFTMGIARLGVLVNFVSDSVIIGFTTGAGILIAINQMRNLLRLTIPSDPAFYKTAQEIIKHLAETHAPSLLLGLGTIMVMIIVKRVKPRWPSALLGMIIASSLVAFLHLDRAGISVLGELPRSLPPMAKLPLFDLELIGKLSTGAMAVAAIGLVEAMSIARAIAAQTGQHLDSNQEFVGQGLANIASGFFSGFTCSGSFTRSAVNHISGARTPMASVFSGVFVLLSLLLFAPLTAYLPRTALAGVLIVTAYGMIDRKEIKRIWISSRGDTVILVATLSATLLLPLEFAIISGITVSFLRYIIKTSMPDVFTVVPDVSFQHFTRQKPSQDSCVQLGVITIGGSLYFGAAQNIENFIRDNLEHNPDQRFLLLRMQFVDHLDISGIHMLESVVRLYRKRGGDIFMAGLRDQVMDRFIKTGFNLYLGENNIISREEAISYIFHKILDPSVCIYECPFRIFAECQALPKQPYEITHPTIEALPDHEITHWMPSEVKDIFETNCENAILIDVREQSEYARGHIPQAQLVPLRRLQSAGTELPRDKQIILICRSGRRSQLGAYYLLELGYTEVYNLQGGMLAWEAAGYPIAVE